MNQVLIVGIYVVKKLMKVDENLIVISNNLFTDDSYIDKWLVIVKPS